MQKNKPNTSKNTFLLAIAGLVAVLIMLTSFVVALTKFTDGDDVVESEASEESTESFVSASPESSVVSGEDTKYDYYDDLNFENYPYRNDAVANGSLAIVNSSSAVAPTVDESKIVNIYQNMTPNVYSLSNISLVLYDEALQSFDRFIVSFFEQVPKNGLIINKGYTSSEAVAMSEHSADLSTGYSVQFSIYNSNYSFSSDEFLYLKEQAFRYGIIQRYPENKEEYTGLEANNTIYRYVGLAHSLYMNHYRYSLEEYIDEIRTERVIEYKSELESNVVYIIYYVPLDESVETTYVPLPTDENCSYSVSGDGSRGFIVTVKMDAE